MFLNFWLHANFYNMEFIIDSERDSLLESIQEMDQIISNCNVFLVDEKVKKLTSITIKSVCQEKCKIGKNLYPYQFFAF